MAEASNGSSRTAYFEAYNDKAEPLVWTKKKVRQRRLKGRPVLLTFDSRYQEADILARSHSLIDAS